MSSLAGQVGVIGVGAMGQGVARALLARGFTVHVRDLFEDREQQAVAAGALSCETPAEVARRSRVVITLVVDAQQTRTVLFGESGAAAAMQPDSALMMCSTIAPADTEALAAAMPGVAFLDAPVSGGPARAHAGTLSVMASGSEAAFARCADTLSAISARCFRVGFRPGDGSRMKVVNNMLAAANLAAGCEAMAMAARLGLDLGQVRDVVNASSGGSWIFADRMERALAGDYAPRAAARVLRKDVTLFVDAAEALGLEAPMARSAQRVFSETLADGLGEEDDAAVLKHYAARYGVKLR